MTTYDDHYARWSYEQLLLKQPHVEFNGLWRIECQHYILCPDAESALTAEGEYLISWFDDKCRVITAPVKIVASCPPNAEQVPERNSNDRVLLAGAPRTCRDVLVDLGLSLPRNFPPFTLDNPGTDVVMVTSQVLTPEETAKAQSIFASFGYYSPLKFSVDPTCDPEAGVFRHQYGQGDIDLIPVRRIGKSSSHALRQLVEEDEQFWCDNRNKVLTTFHTEPKLLLPSDWRDITSLGCFVDATSFIPENIRTYLSLYDTVYLAPPLKETFASNCEALGVTPDELQDLVKMDRLKLVLPQSIDRYPEQWINSIAEDSPKNCLLSRRLAAATISDARRRVPILYTPLSTIERYTLLHAITIHAADLVGAERSQQLKQILAELGSIWSQADWSVQSRGAMGTAHLGIGGIAGTVYRQIAGHDLSLELWSAAQKVEWAAVLGAHVFPSSSAGYNETTACDMVAGLYGPAFSKQAIPKSTALSAVTDLLAIDSKVPVVEFAREFSSTDINRLRELVLRLTRDNNDQNNLSDAIRKFNAEVRHYEKRPDLLKSLNLVGLFSAGAVAAGAVDPTIQKIVPLAGIVLGFVVNRIIDEAPRYSESIGGIVDFLNSALTGKTNAEAVLVARTRKDISRLKQ